MRVYLAISFFDAAGGSEEPLTILATELKKQGHHVTVFSQQPVSRKNQYVRRLYENGVRVIAWPGNLLRLAGDWYYQDRIIRGLVQISYPALAPLSLLIGFVRRQPLRNAWQSAVGRWQETISRVVHQDRRDTIFIFLLDWFTFLRRPDVIHIFRQELHSILDWAERKHIASIYYELSTPGAENVVEVETWQRHRINLNRATLVTAISRATREGLRQFVGIERPIIVIPPVFAETPETLQISTINNQRSVTITCVARLSPEKGLSDLLQAAREVIQMVKDVNFIIAGGGPLMDVLKHETEALGITEKVHFYGPFAKQELAQIMSMTDIFVLSSFTEGIPFTIIEAMAYGKPVVATAVGGVPEVVEDQKTGLLVPPKDPKSLAAALLNLVENIHLRQKMGAAGRQKFEAGSYTVEAYISSTLATYKKAIELTSSKVESLHKEQTC